MAKNNSSASKNGKKTILQTEVNEIVTNAASDLRIVDNSTIAQENVATTIFSSSDDPPPVLTLDQTAGFQNTTNEINLTGSPEATTLANLLTAFSLSSTFAGYTDAAVITQTFDKAFTSVAFALTDSTIVDTGLTDLNGTAINLSSATRATSSSGGEAWYFEGKVETSGVVAFRLLYIPVLTSGQVTGYTLYTLLYNNAVPIFHPEETDPNDPVSMNSLVSAVTTISLTYSDFAGIPPGQNAFGVLREPVGGPDPDPDNSFDVVVTSKVEASTGIINGTINTSNVAGVASAIGVGSQAVNWNEWVLYDFVKNATGNPKNINTLAYGGRNLLTSAFSTVTQLNPGNANTRADVEIRLQDVSNNPQGDALRNGPGAIASNVDIKSVQVFRNGNLTTPIVDFSAAGKIADKVYDVGNGISVIFYNGERSEFCVNPHVGNEKSRVQALSNTIF